MPWPNKGESQEQFVSRCMASPETHKTFPDAKQRAAFCFSRFKEHKHKDKSLANKIEDTLCGNSDKGYGFCPMCGLAGVMAERSPDGKTTCEQGHSYKHSERVHK